jgi:hypothetical protein
VGPEKGVKGLNSAAEMLQGKLLQVLGWERRKRRERILATVACYSLLTALVTLPLHHFLPTAISRSLVPVVIFLALAPVCFLKQRWRSSDTARTLARVDKELRLDERALTAWELLERNETRAAALLVLKQAGERLLTFDPRKEFRRHWGWQGALAPVLLVLWGAFLWFDVDFDFSREPRPAAPQTVAQKLREFSRDLQEKAKNEGLPRSLQMGRELETLAQRGLESKTSDEKFKNELAAMTKKMAAMEPPAAEQASLSAAQSQQDIEDLKAELEAARDFLQMPDAGNDTQASGQPWLDRWASLPQLKKQFETGNQSAQDLSRSEAKSLLDKLEKQVASELDRRSLLDAQQFLEQLMKQGRGEGDANMQAAAPGERETPNGGERESNRSRLPGKEPGKKPEQSAPLPEFQGGAPAHVKGLLGEGQSSGLALKGKPSDGKGKVSQEEVIASYRRQAEAELNSERVPEELKETIKNYFLSLGMAEGKK